MRTQRLVSIFAIAALSACASHRVPAAPVPPPQPSSDWSAVHALPKGTFVLVGLDEKDVRRGLLWCVTDTAVTIREPDLLNTIAREQVARISVQDQIGTRRAPWYIRVPIASAILAGLAGIVGGAVAKNRDVVQASAWTFGIGLATGLMAGPMDYPRPVTATRPVYVRP